MVWIARCFMSLLQRHKKKLCYCCLRRRDEHDGGRAVMASRNHRASAEAIRWLEAAKFGAEV